MARRKDHSREELKALILDAGWRLVGEGGLEALTARRIATEIGYAPGTIYNVFADMDDLVMALNGRTLDMMTTAMLDTMSKKPIPLPHENMVRMATAYMAFARTHKPYWLLLFNYAQPDGKEMPPWYQARIDGLFEMLEVILRPLLPEDAYAGHRHVAARALWSSVHGICMLSLTGKLTVVDKEAKAEELARFMINNFLIGLTRIKQGKG